MTLARRAESRLRQRPSGRALKVALWTLQALLALMFAMAGLAKVGGDQAMADVFATIGIGRWSRHVVDALEIAGAVGVLSRGSQVWPRSDWSV